MTVLKTRSFELEATLATHKIHWNPKIMYGIIPRECMQIFLVIFYMNARHCRYARAVRTEIRHKYTDILCVKFGW
jgi:hypothetical protein